MIDTYCCFPCDLCDIFIATKKNDIEMKKKIAQRWITKFNRHFEPEDVFCDCCKSDEKRLGYFAIHCKIRRCAIEKEVKSCAYCKEYPCHIFEGGKFDFAIKYIDDIRSKLEISDKA